MYRRQSFTEYLTAIHPGYVTLEDGDKRRVRRQAEESYTGRWCLLGDALAGAFSPIRDRIVPALAACLKRLTQRGTR